MTNFDYIKKLSPNKDAKIIVMLHGVGSNKEDLFGLESHFGEDYHIFSLNGLFDLGNKRHAWYHLNYTNVGPKYNPEEVGESYEYIRDFLAYIVETYQLKNENIFLLGFSQGAIMSHYFLGKSPEYIGGIIALSGRYTDEIKKLEISPEKYSNKKVFIAHGTLDTVISVDDAYLLKAYIQKMSISPTFFIYQMPHTIIQEEITEVLTFLEE
ncbi:MAG: alpha/beta hydrolase [Candidatus Altimarinota bacterium]